MRILNRKSQLERFVDGVSDALDVPGGLKFDLPGGGRSGKALKAGLIAVGGLAGDVGHRAGGGLKFAGGRGDPLDDARDGAFEPVSQIGEHRLWGLSYRILDPIIARLLAGEWEV